MFTKASIETYFLAEKNLQLICWLIGLLALMLAAVFFFYLKTQKAKGAAIVLLMMGLIFSVVGLVAYQQNDALRLQQVYAFDMNPISLKSLELPRMQRNLLLVNFLHRVSFVFTLLGVVAYIFTKFKKSFFLLQGSAIATMILASILTGISYLSYHSTFHYIEELEEFVMVKGE